MCSIHDRRDPVSRLKVLDVGSGGKNHPSPIRDRNNVSQGVFVMALNACSVLAEAEAMDTLERRRQTLIVPTS